MSRAYERKCRNINQRGIQRTKEWPTPFNSLASSWRHPRCILLLLPFVECLMFLPFSPSSDSRTIQPCRWSDEREEMNDPKRIRRRRRKRRRRKKRRRRRRRRSGRRHRRTNRDWSHAPDSAGGAPTSLNHRPSSPRIVMEPVERCSPQCTISSPQCNDQHVDNCGERRRWRSRGVVGFVITARIWLC